MYYQQPLEILSALSTGCIYRGKRDLFIICQCAHLSEFVAIFVGEDPHRVSVAPLPVMFGIQENQFYNSIGFILAVLFYFVYIGCFLGVCMGEKFLSRKRVKREKAI